MNRILIVVDMQNDFVTGPLGNNRCAATVPHIVQKIKEAHAAGDTVIFTKDTHGANYPATQEGQRLPVIHCVEYTEGHDLVPDIAAEMGDNDCIFLKPSFGSIDLFNYLVVEDEALGINEIDEIELCGVCTDICVISNAVIAKTACPEARIIVDSKATAGVTPETTEATLTVMKSLQIDVI